MGTIVGKPAMAFSAAIIDSLRVKGIKSCSKSLSLNRWKRPAVAAEVTAAAAAPGDIPAAAAVTDAAGLFGFTGRGGFG